MCLDMGQGLRYGDRPVFKIDRKLRGAGDRGNVPGVFVLVDGFFDETIEGSQRRRDFRPREVF